MVNNSLFRESWLELTKETPLEPSIRICDPHHHLFNDRDVTYLVDDFLQDAAGNNIVKTVYVDCGNGYFTDGPIELRPVGESAFVDRITSAHQRQDSGTAVAAGIVAHADLTLGSGVARVLEAHLAASSRVRAIRHSAVWDPDPSIMSRAPAGMMANPAFRRGLACLKDYHLSFDSWQYFTQLEELADMADAVPDVSIVINHIGGLVGVARWAGRQDEMLQEWRKGITEVARRPNVYMKLGGLGMPRVGCGWHEREKPPGSEDVARAMEFYFTFCLEKFGVDRCMFESNFPMDKKSYSYTVLWNAFKLFSRSFTPGERDKLFYANAIRFYRI